MKQYHDLMQYVLSNGVEKSDRTEQAPLVFLVIR